MSHSECSEIDENEIPDFSSFISTNQNATLNTDAGDPQIHKQVIDSIAAFETLRFPDIGLCEAFDDNRQDERRLLQQGVLEIVHEMFDDENEQHHGDEHVQHKVKRESLTNAFNKGFKSTKKILSKRGKSPNPPSRDEKQPIMKFFLFDDLLLWGEKTVNTSSTHYHVKQSSVLSLMTTGRPYIEHIDQQTFAVSSNEHRLVLHAESEEVSNVWRERVVRVIVQNYEESNLLVTKSRGWVHRVSLGTIWSLTLHGETQGLMEMIETAAVDVNSRDKSGATALHYAAYCGHSTLISILLEAKAEPNTLDDELLSPLHYASFKGNINCAELLLDNTADPDASDLQERTPLFIAVSSGIATTTYPLKMYIDMLCSKGANTEIPDVNSETPLHLAASLGSCPACHSLLSAGASIEATTTSNLSVLHLCCSAEQPNVEMLFLLLSFGANPNALDESGKTALHLIVSNTSEIPKEGIHAAIVLVGHGGRLDIVSKNGKRCDQLAQDKGIDLKDAAEQWKLRNEPVGAVKVLAGVSSSRLPFATSAGHANWIEEGTVDNCNGCSDKFSFTKRKHHCRRCGKVFCSSCTSKSFTLCPRKDTKNVSLSTEKVCTCCFNSLCRVVIENAKAVQATSRPVFKPTGEALASALGSSEVKDREKLFGENALLREQDKAAKAVGTVNAVAQARDKLQERGEKIAALADKSDSMQHAAGNFAENCRKLREKEEKGGWFKGFF